MSEPCAIFVGAFMESITWGGGQRQAGKNRNDEGGGLNKLGPENGIIRCCLVGMGVLLGE